MCNYSQLFILFLFLGHPVLLQHTLNMFTYISGSKGSKKAKAQKENTYSRATFLLRSNMCIFSQLFIVFPFLGHPVWLKNTLNKLIFVFGSKDSQNTHDFKETYYGRATLMNEVKYMHFQLIIHCISHFQDTLYD